MNYSWSIWFSWHYIQDQTSLKGQNTLYFVGYMPACAIFYINVTP